jgi:hypothetical protein
MLTERGRARSSRKWRSNPASRSGHPTQARRGLCPCRGRDHGMAARSASTSVYFRMPLSLCLNIVEVPSNTSVPPCRWRKHTTQNACCSEHGIHPIPLGMLVPRGEVQGMAEPHGGFPSLQMSVCLAEPHGRFPSLQMQLSLPIKDSVPKGTRQATREAPASPQLPRRVQGPCAGRQADRQTDARKATRAPAA